MFTCCVVDSVCVCAHCLHAWGGVMLKRPPDPKHPGVGARQLLQGPVGKTRDSPDSEVGQCAVELFFFFPKL